MIHIGEEIRKKRKELNLTLGEVVEGYMSIAKLSNIENGKVQPDPETWEYLKHRLGLDDDVMAKKDETEKIQLYLSQAKSYAKTGMVDRAIEKYEQVIDRSAQMVLYNEPGRAHRELGTLFLKQQKLDKAVQHYDKALKYYEYADNHIAAMETKMNIGVVYFQQSKFPKSLETFKSLLDEVPEEATDFKGELLYNLGSVYHKLDDFDNANYCCEKAFDNLSESNYEYVIPTLILQSLLLMRVKMYLMAKEKLIRASELSARLERPYYLAKCWHNLGYIESSIGNYENAIEHFNLSLEIKQQLDDENGICRTLTFLSELYFQCGQLQLANKTGMEALRISRSMHLKFEEIDCLNTLGKIQASLNRKEESLDYLFKALTLSDSLNIINKKISILEDIASFFHKTGNTKRCTDFLYQAFLVKININEGREVLS